MLRVTLDGLCINCINPRDTLESKKIKANKGSVWLQSSYESTFTASACNKGYRKLPKKLKNCFVFLWKGSLDTFLSEFVVQ